MIARQMSSAIRNQLTEKIVVARITKKITWAQLSEACGRSEVWTTSALLGQQAMGASEAAAAGQLLGLNAEEIGWLQVPPSKGSLGGAVPTDPLVYRFHEIVEVYGTTLKELIHEKLGDGIMSAIDFEMAVDFRSRRRRRMLRLAAGIRSPGRYGARRRGCAAATSR
jgi:cyanate lyase